MMTSQQKRELYLNQVHEALNTHNECQCSDCGGDQIRGACLLEIRNMYNKNNYRILLRRISETSFSSNASTTSSSSIISSSSISSSSIRITII